MSFLQVLIFIHYLVPSSYSLYRIVGGRSLRIEEAPYTLSLRKEGVHICGAALITPKYALSAAHCFRVPALYSVRAGSHKRDEGGTVSDIRTVILHPERATYRYEYDIAILELEKLLPLSTKIWPVNIAENDQILIPGVKGLISGFGDIYDNQKEGSEILRGAEIYVQRRDLCQMSYVPYGIMLSSIVFCAGEDQKDSCQGDSGGPFVIDNVLYGLVSYGISCADHIHPGVYTSVAKFREFIRLNTGI